MLDAPRLTRRALLASGVGGVVVLASACDRVTDVMGGEQDPGVSGAVSPTAPAADDDTALVEEVAAAVAATGGLALATGREVRALAAVGRRLSRLHTAHASELGWSGTADAPAVRGGRAVALRRLLRAEERLEGQLVDAALRAESGALAQTFASMAAAVAQQRAVLA